MNERKSRRAAWLALCIAPLGWAACTGHNELESDWGVTSSCTGAFTSQRDPCFATDPDAAVPFSGRYWQTIENIQRNTGRAGTRCNPLPNPTNAPSSPATFAVEVVTRTYAGRYGPANSGAVWIETSPSPDPNQALEARDLSVESGEYVRTLASWVGVRAHTLITWNASRCPTSIEADVVATATLEQHEPHELTWNGTDFMDLPVPDGEYVLWVELSEDEIFPVSLTSKLIFRKGPGAAPRRVDELKGFETIAVDPTPSATGL